MNENDLFNFQLISIHALREEGDVGMPLGVEPSQQISIHALREEGDVSLYILYTCVSYFYPRPPRGGRRVDRRRGVFRQVFLSTPSARRATRFVPIAPRS